tara:strand:+ start:15833 stop:16552 length:720 start_codon:yes stop_codon:yes gene_type:complete
MIKLKNKNHFKNCIAIIPARGGSKRIPRKNIKLFNGKPIIYYAIKAVKESKCFDKIIVSTDDNKIAIIAKKLGAEILFKRPKSLSTDHAKSIDAINHAIKELKRLKINFDYICTIYPTNPLLNYKNLIRGYNLIKTKKFNYVFTVNEYPYPIQRSLKIVRNIGVQMLFPKYRNKNSNNLRKIYHDAGQFYFGNKNSFLQEKNMFSKKSFPIIIKKNHTWDIDDFEDWKIAESLFKNLKK